MAKSKTDRKKAPSKIAKGRDQDRPTKAPEQEPVGISANHDTSSPPARPGGKLGLIVDRLAAETGATADELAAATGWQKHTVLGALSRLRSRGFAVRLDEVDGRKVYRLEQPEG